MPENVRMSELFGTQDTLILYSFMYGPEREPPCPGCTHLLDGLDGTARQVGERTALHIVAKSLIARLAADSMACYPAVAAAMLRRAQCERPKVIDPSCRARSVATRLERR